MPFTCPNCQLGRLSETHTTYIQVYASTLIQVPNVAAWKCDVCSETFFDTETIRRVELLIGESGPPPNTHLPGATIPNSAAEPETPTPADDRVHSRSK